MVWCDMTQIYSINTAEWTFDTSMLLRMQTPG